MVSSFFLSRSLAEVSSFPLNSRKPFKLPPLSLSLSTFPFLLTNLLFSDFQTNQPGMRNPSSIIIVLTLKDDPTFEVSGLDLLVTINITLQEALLGFSRVILTHLDKRQIKVDRSSVPGKKTKVTRSGDVDRIRGEGMPGKLGEKGDLYVKWDVDWPEDGWADGEHGDKTRSVSIELGVKEARRPRCQLIVSLHFVPISHLLEPFLQFSFYSDSYC